VFIKKPLQAHILLIYGFVITLISCFLIITLTPIAIAQDDLRVNLFEFSLDPEDEPNQNWKERIQDKILEKLGHLPKITKLDFISNSLSEMLGEEEKYYREMKIRYIIKGKIETISPKRKEIKIVLYDNQMPGENKIKYKWGRKLRNDFRTLEAWADKVATEITSLIEGVSVKEVVFTYCFEIAGDENSILKRLRIKLPKKLKTMLEDKGLSRDYILKTFRKTGDIIEECEKKVEYVPDTNVHEYVIKGEIEICEDSDEYAITIDIDMTDIEGNDVEIEQFREKYSGTFFEALAERIITEWPRR